MTTSKSSPKLSNDRRLNSPNSGGTILRLALVRSRVGISRTSIYQRMSEGTFPKCIRLGPKAVGWLEHEIDDWIAQRVAESRPMAEGAAQ